jgi:spermidine/putrescine transport system permease protein
MPGVVAGTLLTFIPAAGDYINAELLGGPNNKMIGNVIESKFLVPNAPTTSALSFMLMALILLIVTLYIRKAGTDEVV